MNILLSWKLAFASILFLIDFSAELELSDPLTDSSSSVSRNGEPQPMKVSSIKHESVCVNIYESQQTTSRNKKIYFYSPIALPDPINVVAILNPTTTQRRLRISFSIWNNNVSNKVAQHLTQVLKEEIEPNQVKVYPFDSARLISKVQSDDFSLTNEWITNNNNQPTLKFDLICPTEKDCNRVKNEINVNPKKFKHLRLEFNPKLNDESCFNSGLGISQEDLSEQVEGAKQELLANFEAKLAEELNALREMTKNDMEYTNATLSLVRIKLTNTKTTVDGLSTKLNEAKQELQDHFEAKLAEEMNAFRKVVFQDFETMKSELTQTNADLTKRLNVSSENLETTRKELAQTKADLTTKLNLTQKELDLTRNELFITKSFVNDLMSKLNEGFKDGILNNLNFNSTFSLTSEIVDIGKMPTSCFDLQRMGHKLSGFFSVKGSKKMEMVYCDFFSNQNDKQKWIGYADVKSAPVYFYVQRSSQFNTMGTAIPFDSAVLNEGNAMDLQTGKFTAPRTGTYFFSFTGLAEFPASKSLVRFAVAVYWNGDRIGAGFVEESNTLDNQNSPLPLQSTFNLKKDDQVWLQIDAVSSGDDYLYDDVFHYTHFTGFMLEEEIVASL